MLDDDEDVIVPDVPLARLEDDEDGVTATPSKHSNSTLTPTTNGTCAYETQCVVASELNDCGRNDSIRNDADRNIDSGGSTSTNSRNLSTSLENLVENFDESISKVLKNLKANTQQIAPVQVRSQDEVMSESQVWWTLTGNYGNILPLDFNKTQIRKNQIDALRLRSSKSSDFASSSSTRSYEDAGYGGGCGDEDEGEAGEDVDEDELRESMDLHQLISEQVRVEGDAPPISAEQVIEEIDEIMQACDFMHGSMNGNPLTTERTTITTTATTMDGCSVDSMYSSMRSPFTTVMSSLTTEHDDLKLKHSAALSLTNDELSALSQSKLLAISSEMEHLIQAYNKDLVNELAHRDELEYEKEVKNRFITLLLNVQDQRRKVTTTNDNGRRKSSNTAKSAALTPGSQLTTTSIPFDETQATLSVAMLESLTRILQAIGEDSPNVPNLLTEYILTVVCPSTTTSMIA